MNHLYVLLFTSPHDEVTMALDFLRGYRHLIENRPLDALVLSCINAQDFVTFVRTTHASLVTDFEADMPLDDPPEGEENG